MPKRVDIFDVFPQDGRVSMEIYARQLQKILGDKSGYTAGLYTPYLSRLTKLIPSERSRMRWARYVNYPRQARQRAASGADIFHIADHGYAHLIKHLPKDKSVVTVHDLIPIIADNDGIPGMSVSHKPRLAYYSAQQLRHFRQIITISENTRNDIARYCDVAKERIKVLYYGVDEQFSPVENTRDNAIARKYALPDDRPYILLSGTPAYKNTITALKVLQQLVRDQRVSVVHTGPGFAPLALQAQELGIGKHVQFLGHVLYEDLPTIYRRAHCLLFPSLYEGFGWPPLEAMASGCPTIVSNRASLPEVVGDAAFVADALDIDALTEHARTLLTNPDIHAQFRQLGLARAQQFSWKNYAQELIQTYESLGS